MSNHDDDNGRSSGRRKFPYTGGDREYLLPKDEEEQQLRFHYNREERLQQSGGKIGQVDKRPWHKRNRGTFILLLDLSLIILIFIFYNVFLKTDPAAVDFGDHHFELTADVYNDEILATLRITAEKNLVSGSAGIIKARAYIQDREGNTQSIEDLLPEKKNQARILQFNLGPVPADGTRELEIIVDGDVVKIGGPGSVDFSLNAHLKLE